MKHDHYVVLGAWPKADKGALAYYDRDAGMYAVKILQLREDMEPKTGGFDLDDVEGEYITIYFAHQRGRDSLRMMIDALTALAERWDKDAAEAAENQKNKKIQIKRRYTHDTERASGAEGKRHADQGRRE